MSHNAAATALTREALNDYMAMWKRKPVLRAVYGDFYDRIAAACGEGTTLEIGAGIGNLPEKLPDVIGSDIQFGSWLDLVADAQRLPFADGALGNIVMVDVLHHIEHPLNFFREAERALRPGGRVVMIEPGITPLSWAFFNYLHEEPVVMDADPLTSGDSNPTRDPYASNQAIPSLIATRHMARFHALVPGLTIREAVWFSPLSYPLSGGFKPWALLTAGLARALMTLERRIERRLGRFIGFRVMLTFEKSS
ncbi:MAG: class I SAM-dependent methyltransferase [Novosphingobium sp.]|jgi:SAM-dependent methyltransferase|uniref:class I SAM-dependent methyltransferase n=1 Tax=Novosphingobium sp. TaxID=1874826 RepID=UPI0022C8F51A|nr:class I SAM-dependent methyltransferase [Novosphingobium sp.]MCZ8036137.1 class I SAM-dependent methyltransferase [Novosphingobium sp.]